MKSWLKYVVLILCLSFFEGSQSFLCDYEYYPEARGWFRHIVVPATWTDAKKRCAAEGAVLASPATPKIKAILLEIKNSTTTDAQYDKFLGSYGHGAYHDNADMPLWNMHQTWVLNELYADDNKKCHTMLENGDLADTPCHQTHPYICFRPERTEIELNECGTVDSEYQLNNITNKCYKFHTVARNFAQAFLACELEGGNLAIINSETEAKVLGDLFSQQSESTIEGTLWKDVAIVGVHDWKENGDWRTIDGLTLTEAGYNQFSPGEPNNAYSGQHCGGIYGNGKLDDIFCYRQYAFICEKSPNICVALASSSFSCRYPNLFGILATFLFLRYFAS